MHALSASDLLAVWERGQGRLPARRAQLLLAAAYPELAAAYPELGAGQRDALLLALRAQLFGSPIAALASCPGCSEQIELDFDTAAISAPAGTGGLLQLASAGYTLVFRLPNCADLAGLDPQAGDDQNRRWLFERCLLAARRGAEDIPAAELPEPLVAAAGAHMAAADPAADVQLALTCPACGTQWLAQFDIVAFFWAELHAWALRTLREIHALARAYGWGEQQILALSPWRRQAYLDLVLA